MQKVLVIASNDYQMTELRDTFVIEEIYKEPLGDLAFTYIYVAASFSHDARLLKTGYIGKLKSTTISNLEGKWKYKFIVAELLTFIEDSKGLPKSVKNATAAELVDVDLGLYLSPSESEGLPNPALKVNHHEDQRLLTIVDAIDRIADTYNVSRANVKISISG